MLNKRDYINLYRGTHATQQTKAQFLNMWCQQEGKSMDELVWVLQHIPNAFHIIAQNLDSKYKVSILVNDNGEILKVV